MRSEQWEPAGQKFALKSMGGMLKDTGDGLGQGCLLIEKNILVFTYWSLFLFLEHQVASLTSATNTQIIHTPVILLRKM